MRRSTARAKNPLSQSNRSDPRHGTPGGRSYWGCRCNRCLDASLNSRPADEWANMPQERKDQRIAREKFRRGLVRGNRKTLSKVEMEGLA